MVLRTPASDVKSEPETLYATIQSIAKALGVLRFTDSKKLRSNARQR